MEIANNLVETFIKSWKTDVDWSADEYEKIKGLLLKISFLNGGQIKYDVELDNTIRDQYLLKTIKDGLNKVMNIYRDKLQPTGGNDFYWKETNKLKPSFPFTKGVKYHKKIELNSATAEELATIPLIDKTISERIVEFRRENGMFSQMEELLKIDGIDEASLRTIQYAFDFSEIVEKNPPNSAEVDAFIQKPDFSNFLKVIKKEGTNIFDNLGPEPVCRPYREEILRELKNIADFIEKNHFPKFKRYRRVKASRIKEDYDNQQFASTIEQNWKGEYSGSCLLDDTQYFYFLLQALKTAQKSIRIIMFFMAYYDAKKYPTDKIFDAIVEAKLRGVDTKIILDKDAEGEVYGSRLINTEAYNKFVEQGIDVLFDLEEKVTHSKIVVIDGKHSIIGSHNWTAGSFFAYDDKSIYIESADFGSKVNG